MVLERFDESLSQGQVLAALRAGMIGEGAMIEGPDGPKPLTYVDSAATGRALEQVEDFIAQHVLPFHGAGTSDTSYTGRYAAGLREEARAVIARHVGAGTTSQVKFTGTGATAAANLFITVSGLSDLAHAAQAKNAVSRALGRGPQRPLVLVGAHEPAATLQPWRESGAELREIPDAPGGGPDLVRLEAELRAERDRRPMILGAFSAASNITGILADVVAVTSLLKSYGALACWDYAAAGPFETIRMNLAPGCEIDAIFLAPHRFAGGPGAAGVLVVRNDVVKAQEAPTHKAIGRARKSSWDADTAMDQPDDEELGSPSVIADVRAALAFQVKAAIGAGRIHQRQRQMVTQVFDRLGDVPNLEILGRRRANRLPIFSFVIRDGAGNLVDHARITRVLSDRYGIQSSDGGADVGDYARQLLKLDDVPKAEGQPRPGWTRLHLSYLMDEATVLRILESVRDIARAQARIGADTAAMRDEDHRHIPPLAASA